MMKSILYRVLNIDKEISITIMSDDQNDWIGQDGEKTPTKLKTQTHAPTL